MASCEMQVLVLLLCFSDQLTVSVSGSLEVSEEVR